MDLKEQLKSSEIDLDVEYSRECRILAMQIADNYSPSGYKKPLEVILSDADKIYEWLTKDI